MTDEQETHYEVVGVEPRASKEEIRDAYRARIDELAEGKQSDESRQEMARLSSAWQVLSDPFQRDRYDQSIGVDAEAAAAGGESEDADSEEAAAVPATRTARWSGARDDKRARPEPGTRVGLFSAEHEDPPPTWPPGFRPPPPRARVIAMVIDLAVLVAMVLVVQVVGARVIDSVYKEETESLDAANDRIDQLEDARDDAEDRVDAAEEDIDQATEGGDDSALETARAEKQAAEADVDGKERSIDSKQERIDDLEGDLAPAQLAIQGVILVLALVYLVPSTVISGRTFGKSLMRIRVIDATGTKVGVRSALMHYGLPVLASLALLPILGPLVVGLVILGVLTWPRNPNRQGLHDRLAGTLVVDG